MPTGYEQMTVYRYRDMTKIYHFLKWGEWTAFSDQKVTATDLLQVEEKTYYRYRDKKYKTVCIYGVWSDWTGWSDNEVSASGTRRVETRTVYRYRKK